MRPPPVLFSVIASPSVSPLGEEHDAPSLEDPVVPVALEPHAGLRATASNEGPDRFDSLDGILAWPHPRRETLLRRDDALVDDAKPRGLQNDPKGGGGTRGRMRW